MQKYFIGIDLGTGSTKAIAVGAGGAVLCTSQKHYPITTPQPGHSEQNPCLIWEAFVFCINETISKLGQSPTAISFSAAMHSVMAIDVTGAPISNALLWSDARSGEIAQSIRKSTQAENIYRHTGTAIYAMSPLCKIIWWRYNDQDLYAKAFKFISIKEYIWYRLFGVYEVDHAIASATGLLDILTRDWYGEALELAGITSYRLSNPVPTKHYRFLPAVSHELPTVDLNTAFVIGASDGCCANLGGNAIAPGLGALTIGTSGAVRVGSPNPIYNFEAMTFNYILDEEIFICGGAVNNGGSAMDWLVKDFLKLSHITPNIYEQLFETISTVPAGSNGLLFLPYLYAERAPVWDAKASSAFLNIDVKHQQQHFLRAAVEGICYALNDVLSKIETPSQPIEYMVISGGFISSREWVQILADVTGKKLIIQQAEDASAMGAVYLAMQALNIAPFNMKHNAEPATAIILPDGGNHAVYKKAFEVYRQLYKNLRQSMHLMHELKH